MAAIKSFIDLEIWQLANELEKKVFEQLKSGDLSIDIPLQEQMNRAVGSIADNIAEGFGSKAQTAFIHFLEVAKASTSALQSQLVRCLNRNYLATEIYDHLSRLTSHTGKKIATFIEDLHDGNETASESKNIISTNGKQETSDNVIKTTAAAKPLGAYPHARKAGNLLFLSGIGSRRADDNIIPGLELDEAGNIVKYNIEAECHSVFANVKAVLEASGSSWEKIIDVTVFLTNMKDDFPVYNKIYGGYFNGVQACRTTVEVKSLPTPICIELKVIALI